MRGRSINGWLFVLSLFVALLAGSVIGSLAAPYAPFLAKPYGFSLTGLNLYILGLSIWLHVNLAGIAAAVVALWLLVRRA
ncbi:MAG: hypothetical protein M0Z27_06050 [Thermaerobacter sp.]|nr:hypothetical protein [Thermaerobacter sp.]MDA8145603.1 hypothetical protein [Thermaerobacter sp.]